MFFIFPIGHEDAKFRRFPVVSLAIVAGCLMAFGYSWPRLEEDGKLASKIMEDVLDRIAGLAAANHADPEAINEMLIQTCNCQDPRALIESIEKAVEKLEKEGIEADDLAPIKDEIRQIQRLFDEQTFRRYGLVPSAPTPLAFLTHMFLHGGFMHLIFNLLFFILVGPSLEDLWGRAAFPIIYLLSGLAAAVGFMAVSGPVDVPMIGASGAIAGLMGAFLVAFTHTRIRMFGIVFLFVVARIFTFMVPAWVFLPLWIGWEIFQGIQQLGTAGVSGGGVAHWAHISGFFFGFAVPLVLRFTGLDRKLFPMYEMKGKSEEVHVHDPALAYMHDAEYRRGVHLREEGDWIDAAESFQRLAERHPEVLGPRLELAETYRLGGDDEKRREALLAALDLAANLKDRRILEVYDALRREYPRASIPAESLFRIGIAFEGAGEPVEAMEHLKKFLKLYPEHPLRIRAAVRLSDILSGPMKNPKEARALLAGIRGEGAGPLWKDEVERRLKELEKGDAGAGQKPASARGPLTRTPG